MESHTLLFDSRSAAERIAQAERFERMAEQFKDNPNLRIGFNRLAEDAREQVRRLGG